MGASLACISCSTWYVPNELDRVGHAAGAIMHDGGSQHGWTVLGETLQCVHCGGHWIMEPGSGRERGFCARCMGPVCGMRNCWECIPEEQMLTNIETQWRARYIAATDDAEEVVELLRVDSDSIFTRLVERLYTARATGVEYRARMDANIRAIKASW
jgi:hypothetical protein